MLVASRIKGSCAEVVRAILIEPRTVPPGSPRDAGQPQADHPYARDHQVGYLILKRGPRRDDGVVMTFA